MVSHIETIVRNYPNGEFINLRDEDDDETKFQDELESDDENKDDESYYESDSK